MNNNTHTAITDELHNIMGLVALSVSNTVNYWTFSGMAKLSAHNFGITGGPWAIRQSSPCTGPVNLHSTLPIIGSTHQTNVSLSIRRVNWEKHTNVPNFMQGSTNTRVCAAFQHLCPEKFPSDSFTGLALNPDIKWVGRIQSRPVSQLAVCQIVLISCAHNIVQVNWPRSRSKESTRMPSSSWRWQNNFTSYDYSYM